jgi:hypothetical protein
VLYLGHKVSTEETTKRSGKSSKESIERTAKA